MTKKPVLFRAEGHLIDDGILHKIFDKVLRSGAEYEVVDFRIGRHKDQTSRITISVLAPESTDLDELLPDLVGLGCELVDTGEIRLEPAPRDGVAPENFYSTTNHSTEVKIGSEWVLVEHQRMDALIVVEGDRARCVKLRDVVKGQPVVVGTEGVRVSAPAKDLESEDFGFMNSEVSSERHVELVVDRLAHEILARKRAERGVIFVAGPVVVHTGGVEPMERLIAGGVVDGILGGNAIAVHDIERALLNTSLGIDAGSGQAVPGGHSHHMRAINEIRRAGSIRDAVEQGVLTRGIMHACEKHQVPYVLAGSLRDDGPLPEVITDMNEAQAAYAAMLEGAGLVLILSSMLHGIATGNMLPSRVTTVCVDINPAVVTKLCDRGSSQAVGVVTDVGLFLHTLADRMERVREMRVDRPEVGRTAGTRGPDAGT